MILSFHRNAFVDLINADDLDKAMALAGSEIDGRAINIDKAKPKGAPREQNTSFGSPGFGGNQKEGDYYYYYYFKDSLFLS